jgi:hypothetical protein
VDIEPRRIRLQSNSYTTNTLLDTVTAATVQVGSPTSSMSCFTIIVILACRLCGLIKQTKTKATHINLAEVLVLLCLPSESQKAYETHDFSLFLNLSLAFFD